MNKTIEFVEKEIKNIKELLELDDVLCLSTDEDYKFCNDRLKTFQKIKEELEAWEVVKKFIVDSNGVYLLRLNSDDDYDNEYYQTLKKAMDVE